jgi:hypothetical protein
MKTMLEAEKKGAGLQRRVLARMLAEDIDLVSGGTCPSGHVTSNSCGNGCDRFDSDTAKLCEDAV